jgi:hypothetical protein
MLERDIEAAVCKYAKDKGFLVYKFSSPNHAGVPDRMFIAPHQRAFWIEFKREGGKLTPLQERECDKLANCGFEVYICDSVEQGKSIIDEQAQIAATVFAAFLQVSAMRCPDDESVH